MDFPCEKDEWVFADDISNGKLFYFEGIRIRMIENEEMYVDYSTEKRLSKEQIERFVRECSTVKKLTYLYNGVDRYASIIDYFNIIMHDDENNIYY